MKYNILFKTILFSVILAVSCKTEADNTIPVIEILSISPQLGSELICGVLEVNNVISLNSSDSLKLELRLSDNKGLSQLKIDIHENFDCHGHKAAVSPWQVLDLIDLNGTEQMLNLSIPVPATASAGTYHFQIRLLDESGNEAGGNQAYSIKLLNIADTVAPTAIIQTPVSDTVSLNRGDNFILGIRAEDNNDLGGGRAELIYFTGNGNKITADSFVFADGIGNVATFSLEYILPNTLPVGNYEFIVRIFDAVGNSYDSSPKIVQLN